MQISITARHCEIASGVRTFAQTRLEKLGKYAKDIHGIHVIVQPEGKEHQAEITLSLNGHEFVSKELHPEAGAAIEKAADRMEEQLRRFKEKRIGRRHNGAAKEIPLGSPRAEEDDEEEA
ncbi:MAG: ribosome-associated translation inhibitor RaiA [Candidatus Eisenbacteria bacterium]